eukprot:8057371-Alexandrium_andersonii.AAC.1
MSASLVGSEMCIRDSVLVAVHAHGVGALRSRQLPYAHEGHGRAAEVQACLLYTSDAADDM